MPDTVSTATRSRIMSRIKSKGTKPEVIVRRLIHGLGYRYRLHRSDLPGRPDLVFPSRRKVVFVNGCFWHYHSGCPQAHIPASNRHYWLPKLTRTRTRDEQNCALLEDQGWSVTTVWDCQLKDMANLTERLVCFLEEVPSESQVAKTRTQRPPSSPRARG